MKRAFELATPPFRILGSVGMFLVVMAVIIAAYATATPAEREAFLSS